MTDEPEKPDDVEESAPASEETEAVAADAAGAGADAPEADGPAADAPEADAPPAEPAPKPRRRRRKAAEPVAEETPVEAVAEEPAAEEAPADPDLDAAEEAEDEEEAEAAGDEPEAEEPVADQPAPARPARSAPGRRRSRRDPDLPAPVVRAQAKYVRSSARKARLVCDHIRGKSVEEARAILALTPRAIAQDWSKLLESAVANAEHNHELVSGALCVKAVHGDEGPTIKRFRPRAMGRATRIRKRTSHLTILLTPKD